MPLVSIITPTQARNADWIGETYASIADSALPDGWEWEWLVQEDGDEPGIAVDAWAGDDRVRYAALGVQVGSGATRNAALVRARGDVVAGMDHDDVYADGGLRALVEALDPAGEAQWACGRCDWLLPDGGRWAKDDVLPTGPVDPGAITRYYLDTGDWPFPAAFAVYRRRPLIAAGGWPAMVRSEDAALLLGFAHHRAGVWVDRVVATYRRWPGQKTVRPEDLALRAHAAAALRQRAEVLGES